MRRCNATFKNAVRLRCYDALEQEGFVRFRKEGVDWPLNNDFHFWLGLNTGLNAGLCGDKSFRRNSRRHDWEADCVSRKGRRTIEVPSGLCDLRRPYRQNCSPCACGAIFTRGRYRRGSHSVGKTVRYGRSAIRPVDWKLRKAPSTLGDESLQMLGDIQNAWLAACILWGDAPTPSIHHRFSCKRTGVFYRVCHAFPGDAEERARYGNSALIDLSIQSAHSRTKKHGPAHHEKRATAQDLAVLLTNMRELPQKS